MTFLNTSKFVLAPPIYAKVLEEQASTFTPEWVKYFNTQSNIIKELDKRVTALENP